MDNENKNDMNKEFKNIDLFGNIIEDLPLNTESDLLSDEPKSEDNTFGDNSVVPGQVDFDEIPYPKTTYFDTLNKEEDDLDDETQTIEIPEDALAKYMRNKELQLQKEREMSNSLNKVDTAVDGDTTVDSDTTCEEETEVESETENEIEASAEGEAIDEEEQIALIEKNADTKSFKHNDESINDNVQIVADDILDPTNDDFFNKLSSKTVNYTNSNESKIEKSKQFDNLYVSNSDESNQDETVVEYHTDYVDESKVVIEQASIDGLEYPTKGDRKIGKVSTSGNDNVTNDKATKVSTTSGGFGNDESNIICKSVEDVMHQSMMPYTEHVILDRALPRVEDGLKPVQRRILFTMMQLGLDPDKPFKKSARIVGDCLGKYHPHGDCSVYDAMVRLAQPYNMRELLVHGHGNFGSVDGDGAAAMRYTEARLAPLAMELLKDLDKDTVKFVHNFDDSLKEPETLPGHYPNLLVNGASGIAVGLATNIPPHNLAETVDGVIAYIDKPNIKLSEIMRIIKGPDFPTGGYIIDNGEIERAYETGRGKIIMRAKMHIETYAEGKKAIVITEFPYQTNKATLLSNLAQLLNENKQTVLGGIADIADESDRQGTRAVIKLKKDVDVDKIVAQLFKSTGLESSFGINMVAIADGRPQQMAILDIIAYYTNYQRDVVLKRTKFDLEDAKAREHILEGLIIAIQNIDEVIKIIKKSASTNEAKASLRTRFDLSDKQAQAILDMRLARLTSLEVYKLQTELAEVKALIEKLLAIVNSKKLQLDVVKQEMITIKKNFKNDRRSIILKTVNDYVIPSDDDVKPMTEVVVGLTAKNDIKAIPYKNYSMSTKEFNDKSSFAEIFKTLTFAQSDYTLLMFSNKGNCFKLDVEAIGEQKWKDKGVAIANLIKNLAADEKIIFTLPMTEFLPQGQLIFFTREGMVKCSDITEYSLLKSFYNGMKLKETDEIINVELYDKHANIIFITKDGMVLHCDKSDVPMQGRVSIGVKGINLNEGDYVVFGGQISDKLSSLVLITKTGLAKKVKIAELDVLARYRKGLKIYPLENDEIVMATLNSLDNTLIAKVDDGEVIIKNTKEIVKDNRTGKGKQLFKINKKQSISEAYVFLTDYKEYKIIEPKNK